MIELAEWYCRTYSQDIARTLWETPAAFVCLSYRVWAQAVGGNRTRTLLEEEDARDRWQETGK